MKESACERWLDDACMRELRATAHAELRLEVRLTVGDMQRLLNWILCVCAVFIISSCAVDVSSEAVAPEESNGTKSAL